MTAKTKVNSSAKRSADQAKARAKAAEPKIVPAPKKNTPAVLVRKSHALQINSGDFLNALVSGVSAHYADATVSVLPIYDGGQLDLWIVAKRVFAWKKATDKDGMEVDRPIYHWAIGTMSEFGDFTVVVADGDRATCMGALKGRAASREILNAIASGDASAMPKSFDEVREFNARITKSASVFLR